MSEARRYWAGKRGERNPHRQRYAPAPGSVTHTLRLGGGLLVSRHGFARNRLCLIAAGSGLMTESVIGLDRNPQTGHGNVDSPPA